MRKMQNHQPFDWLYSLSVADFLKVAIIRVDRDYIYKGGDDNDTSCAISRSQV